MATYSNIGIKLITTGDESGTWGTSTNENFSDVLDEAIAGAITYNISSDADFTLTVSDGTSSDARHAVIKFTSTTLTATRVCTFAPNDLQKTWVVINSTTGGQSLTFKQGSAGGTVTVPNGESAIIYSDGGGASAGAITRVLDSFTNTKITTGTLNATTLDLTNLEVTNVKAKDGTAAITIADSTGKVTVSTELAVDNLNLSGNTITSTDTNGNIDLTPNGTGEVNITKVDIDSGAIDGTTIGGSTAAAGSFTTLTTSSTVTLNGGTANGVLYLNASKVATSGSGLVFDGTNLTLGSSGKLLYSGVSYGVGIDPDGSGGFGAGYNFETNSGSPRHLLTGPVSGQYISSGSVPYIAWYAGSSAAAGTTAPELARLNSTGLGIGTSSPTTKLHVVGTTRVSNSGADAVAQLYGPTGYGEYLAFAEINIANRGTFGFATGSGTLQYRYGATTMSDGTLGFAMDSSGNLGIGTSSPSVKLQVNTGTNGTAFTAEAPSATNSQVNIGIGVLSAGRPFVGTNTDSNEFEVGTRANTSMLFVTNSAERMRITSAGDVGIGTNSPTYKLDVQSATSVIQNKSTTGTNASYYIANNTGGDFYIGRDNSTGATFGTNTGYTSVLWSAGLYPMTFHTNGIERLRISDTGNLGLGVTPSAWGSGYVATQISNAVSTWAASGGSAYRSHNVYYDGSNRKYVFTGTAHEYEQGSGGHVWSTAASGTAGNNITFTQALTLNANGALILQGGDTGANGVGVTFPATQSASSNANTLDDYEEGTWNPTITGSTSNPSVTYSNQEGFYCKIGRTVVASGRFVTSAWSGGSGDLRVSLPFTANSTSGFRSSGSCSYILSITNGGSAFVPQVSENTAYMTFYKYTDADEFVSSVLANDNTSGTTQVNFCVTYQV